MSWRYVVINKCIVSCLHIWKMVPLGVNLKIKYSISLFSILNRVAIWMYFAFKQGQNWRVLAPQTQPNFIPIPSSSPSPREKFLPLCIAIIQQQNRFFFQSWIKNKGWNRGGSIQTSPDPDMINIPPTFRTTTRTSHTSNLTTCKIPRKIDLLLTWPTLWLTDNEFFLPPSAWTLQES